MGRFSEAILFWLAKQLYHTEVAHSRPMKAALTSRNQNNAYRSSQVDRVMTAARHLNVEVIDRDVLDLGCNDGALTVQLLMHGSRKVVGVDIDSASIEAARRERASHSIDFLVATTTTIPLPDESVDTIICFDVFEHVSQPALVIQECKRVLRPNGQMLIGTWGWYHPFAPHLWATMPVPWAHVLFSERTILRTCRRVFDSPWYVSTMHDVDENGVKRVDRYLNESISTDYLNKYLIRDFEKVFSASGMQWSVHLESFSSRIARVTRVFLRFPYMREFFASYMWAVLKKASRPTLK